MGSSAGMDQIRAAVVDGRTANVRYRQNELQALHQALCNNVDEILLAITKDSSGDGSTEPSFEADAEYSHTMSAVKQFYSSLNFEQLHKDEYLLANGADNPSRRVGKGLVVIRPTTHTRLYSIVCPIAAAVIAGNCVCLELEDTILNIDRVLKKILAEALDDDTFYISNTTVKEPTAFVVDQTSTASQPTLNQLSSNATSRTVAIVDRAADVELAAKTIINARFSFQGNSTYSPDLVIVNDFVKARFTEACIQYASKFHTKKSHRRQQISSQTKKAFKEAEEKGQISVFGSSDFVLADVRERNCSITKMKVSGCYLPILECTSLVDALMSQKSESTFLAAYLFSDPPTAKFLAQHLDATVTYVNQIPAHLLIGPAAPITSQLPPFPHKYSTEMFSSERPEFISPPVKDLLALESILGGTNATAGEEMLVRELRKNAVEPLPKTGQPLGHAVGFFEQGIFLGAGLFLSLVIPSLAYGSWVLGRGAWRLAKR
ncbi:aldehyde dehydrogenase-like protein PutA [Cadophora sp. DSE1049]|nr:aldehyde dehydrogenase-like protein PutA [Cadophora sp. DSE1049]